MLKKSNIDLSDTRKKIGLTQAEMSEMLGITINYLSILENGHKPIAKKIQDRLNSIIEKSNIDIAEPEKGLTANENQAKYNYESRDSTPSTPEQICAQHALMAYRAAEKNNLQLQFATLMWLLCQAIENLDDPWPVEQVVSILDRIARRDYPQCKPSEKNNKGDQHGKD